MSDNNGIFFLLSLDPGGFIIAKSKIVLEESLKRAKERNKRKPGNKDRLRCFPAKSQAIPSNTGPGSGAAFDQDMNWI